MPATEVIVMGTFFLVIGWVLRTLLTNRRRVKIAQLQTEVQVKLIERFGSGAELAEFMGGESGKRLLESTAAERVPYQQRILGSIQAGIILAVTGAAMAWLGEGHHDLEGFVFLGILACAVGIGFLLAAGAAMLLSKKWGLIEGPVD
jgi:hypothetical protein